MSKRAIILILAALAVVSVIAFMLRVPDPQAVLRQATKRLTEEKTFQVELKATMVGELPELEGGTLSANATGVDMLVRAALNRTDPLNPASVSVFEVQQGLTGGGTARLAGEARRKDGLHYLRLTQAEGVQGMEASRATGVWMKSDRPFLDLLFAKPTGNPLDAAGFETMRTNVQALDLFTVVQRLPNETLDGRKMLHYSVELNMEAISAILLKLREVRARAPVGTEDVLAVTAELVAWNRPVGEVWVDAKTRRFKQITLGTPLGESGESGAAAGTLVFSNEGVAVAVESPEAEDVGALLGPLFQKGLNLSGDRAPGETVPQTPASASATPGTATQTDTDGDGLVDAQEFFYGSDPRNPDTDGDGASDGREVEKGMNPAGTGTLYGFGL